MEADQESPYQYVFLVNGKRKSKLIQDLCKVIIHLQLQAKVQFTEHSYPSAKSVLAMTSSYLTAFSHLSTFTSAVEVQI